MNAAVERILREFESTRAFGSVEIVFINGVPITFHVTKNSQVEQQ
jgi:hypothetical protein